MTCEVIAERRARGYRRGMETRTVPPVGEILRQWRERRRLSQLALALDAEVSARHVSFVETGKARPSREMLLRLAERLEVPLRDRNLLLLAGGFAPAYPERPLDDPDLGAARAVVERVLAGHEPYPALAVDRRWTLLVANGAVAPLLEGVDTALLRPPVNVLRLSLHPDGMAPRIANLGQWRAHVLERLRRQVASTADAMLASLLDELRDYPPGGLGTPADARGDVGVAVPLRLRTADGPLSFLSTTMVFGTPVDVTLAELAVEAFFPADADTVAALGRAAAGREGTPDPGR
jgi:transcriptional regulator with XRE-family HTH domain